MLIIADSKTPLPQDFSRLGELRQLPTKEITHDALRDAEMLVVRSETRVDRALLEGTQVRFVGTATIGTDHVDLNYLHERGIGFASAPGSNANSVAEYLCAALLELERQGGLAPSGAILGIVGVGNVGSRVVRVARSLGMEVLLNDPPLARATGNPRYLPLDSLMEADVITLHVPFTRTGTDPTFHLFDASRIATMKKGSILINTSRGGVVDGQALKDALRNGRIDRAVLDVWEKEPNIDAELLAGVAIGTPHIAGYSRDGKTRAAEMIYDAACRFFHAEPPAPLTGPAQETAAISVSPETDRFYPFLRGAVSQAYDIMMDDADLRRLLTKPAEERGDFFRSLRARYRVRKEFTNFEVRIHPSQESFGPRLAALGFRIAGGGDR